jgi:hypothetical protein
MLLLDRFFNFIITAHLHFRRASADHRCMQCVIAYTKWHLDNPTVVKENEASYIIFSQIMPYILSMMICIDMILLDNLLQYLICIIMIDLSSTRDCTSVLICKSLVMFMSYFWIKIKLKMLLFLTIQKPYSRHIGFMAEFVVVVMPTPFTGMHFKIWKVNDTL